MIFLRAEWRWLAMMNYVIDPALLRAYIPLGTELDLWEGKAYVSMVGFLFLRTKVLGVPIPFHRNFEEVNLRMYVRRKGPEGWRRGVVFIKEIVPRRAIAQVARTLYNENYVAMPMAHHIKLDPQGITDGEVEYLWRYRDDWNQLRLVPSGAGRDLVPGSEAEFITEHYWGYARQRNGGTMEYQVEHPRWRVWSATEATLECDVEDIYAPEFCEALNGPPESAFLAEGSKIVVRKGMLIRS